MKYKSITGTKDILPPDSGQWLNVEKTIREIFNLYSFEEIRTPIFEETQLFARSIGEDTDIVGKEMYTFLDKGGTSITLRPELTASVMRAYIQHNVGEQSTMSKFYYIGPVFRQERPQAGRFRQFHQFGAEAIGSQNPAVDAEMISLSIDIYNKFGIFNSVLKINSIGCPECRKEYKRILVENLSKKSDLLSAESKKRLNSNPLRILDSKDENDRKVIEDVPLLLEYLCNSCRDHFTDVRNNLKEMNVDFIIDGTIVRGLDYYTKTAYEIISNDLGSQDALAGGGRYDRLIEELGGKPTPGVGFAAGMERLMLVLEKNGKYSEENKNDFVYLAVVDVASRKNALKIARMLRNNNLRIDMDFHERSLKAQFREANKKKAKTVLILSEEEYLKKKITIKDMASGEQKVMELDDIVNEIKVFNKKT